MKLTSKKTLIEKLMFWKKKSELIADKKPEFVNPDRLNDVIVLDNKNYIVIDCYLQANSFK